MSEMKWEAAIDKLVCEGCVNPYDIVNYVSKTYLSRKVLADSNEED